MPKDNRSVRLSELYQIWEAQAEIIGHPAQPDPPIEHVALWEPSGTYQAFSLILAPRLSITEPVEDFAARLSALGPACVMLIGWTPAEIAPLCAVATASTIALAPKGLNATTIFESVLRATVDPTTAELRRLTALQRSFTQELSSAAPIQAILDRLQKLSSAVCLVVTSQGTVRESTGQVPIGTIFEQLSKTESPSQFIAVGDWSGQAIRLRPVNSLSGRGSWLVAACRRPGFPDSSNSAAIHIAASLIETVQRIDTQARSQEEAVRTSLFEQALAFKPMRDAPELESRVAALGLSFDLPLRVIVVAPRTSGASVQRSAFRDTHDRMSELFADAEIAALSTTREDGSVFLAQASEATIQRILRTNRKLLGDVLFGLGRNIHRITETADSFTDAWLGIRTLRAKVRDGNHISFEQFDFATRLFSNVGIDVMAKWSMDYLAPLLEREQILSGLRKYFHHSQNIAAAADALGIHHNSLRYRLTKVEELLKVNLRDPAAISSLFLAITSLDLAVLSGSAVPVHPTLVATATPTPAPAPENSAGFRGEREHQQRPGAKMSPTGTGEFMPSALS